ncbi:MAG: septum formation protein Maf [Bacteroidaceae bacterium]|jgi:septum formation protein|nr:septum formation protein Maf [Bacteroidaceae bacterium]
MLDNLKKYKVVLASNSPRRKELLGGLGIGYEVKTMPDIDESYPDGLCMEEVPVYIARSKADAYRPLMQPDELIITADTIVWLDGVVMGKPKDEEEARDMLRRLSGQTHQVVTGVCLTTIDRQQSFATVTDVTFDRLTEEEITHYVSRYQPMDKAGAYGIQEWIGYVGVRSIKGSYFNVVGLPIQRLYQELKRL